MSFQIAERDWRDGRDEGGFIWLVSFNQTNQTTVFLCWRTVSASC
jgi:hypothetical protein